MANLWVAEIQMDEILSPGRDGAQLVEYSAWNFGPIPAGRSDLLARAHCGRPGRLLRLPATSQRADPLPQPSEYLARLTAPPRLLRQPSSGCPAAAASSSSGGRRMRTRDTEDLLPCFPHSLNRRASACGSGRTPAPQPSRGPDRAPGGCGPRGAGDRSTPGYPQRFQMPGWECTALAPAILTFSTEHGCWSVLARDHSLAARPRAPLAMPATGTSQAPPLFPQGRGRGVEPE
jgi:hypothetical protein